MKNPTLLILAALLAAGGLTPPLAADGANGPSGVPDNVAASHDNETGSVSSRSQDDGRKSSPRGDADRGLDRDREERHDERRPLAEAQRRAPGRRKDRGLRSEYQPYSTRLTHVEESVDKAEREHRYTRDEARLHRRELAAIRARFRRNSDRQAEELNDRDRQRLELDIHNQELRILIEENR